MRILVTGANGFVGHHAVAHLLAAGHDVVGASIEGTAPAGARPVRLDVRDHHVMVRVLETVLPDAILHLAGIAYVPAARRDPRGAFETNANGSLCVMAACAEVAADCRVVLVSSAEVYGVVAGSEPIVEDQPLRPVTVYGASKAAAEHLAVAYAREGLDVVVLRPFNHIGPGQADTFMVASFARQIAQLERVGGGELRHGNLSAIRDFLDVRDIVRAYELALLAPRGRLVAGQPYNLCSGHGVSVEQIVTRLIASARVAVRPVLDADRLRPVDLPVLVGDPGRFRAATGFAPTLALDDTLADILAAARN